MKYWTKFKVTGSSLFPLDMLRYDQCFPYTAEDASKIGGDLLADERTVTLAFYHPRRLPTITTARWKSFGWTVDENETETLKL